MLLIVQLCLFYVIVISKINDVSTLNDTLTNPPDNKTAVCTSEKCVMKCCPFDKFISSKIVREMDKNNEISKTRVKFCDNHIQTRNISHLVKENIFSNRPNSTFDVKHGIFEIHENFSSQSINVASINDFNVYLTENAEILLEVPNAYHRWSHFTNEQFCWDYKIVKNKKQNTITLLPGIWILIPDNGEGYSEGSATSIIMTTSMLISSFFLLVVLAVYGLLKELRNLCGLILMAYVASLFGAFLLLAIMRMDHWGYVGCVSLTFPIYYMFLASFCWMNVMSYDIWWTFRGYTKVHPIHRRGERFKFLMYCLYAWGVPLAMTIALGVLNSIDMSVTPWFITPNIPTSGCFIEGGEKFIYLYIPMLILIIPNWMFYLMTAYNVWRLSHGTAVQDSCAVVTSQVHRKHFDRFLVYLKLSVIMGLNWVLEVVSYLYPAYNSLWLIFDLYNMLIGFFIFLIFVCKRKIRRKLTKLFLRLKIAHWRPSQMNNSSRNSSTSESSNSEEAQSLQAFPATPMDPKVDLS